MKSYSFPRELRLLTPSQFSRIFDHPVKAVSDHLTLLAKFNDTDHPRLGLTIAKKKEKTAVGRNRVKRIIRDSFRLNQHNMPNIDIVVIARNDIGSATNQQLQKQLTKLWKKISQRCEKSSKA